MRRLLPVFVIAIGLSLPSGLLVASTFLSAEFKEVVTDASTIVRGRVTDVRAVRSTVGDVESVVTIGVDSVLKGTADTFVTMRVPGGTIGRYRTVMTGAPVMRVGDQAVFFLKRGPANAWWPVGLTQGIYRVHPAEGGGGQVHAPVLASVTTNGEGAVVRGDSRRKSLPVTEFESLVRLVLTRGVR